LIIGNNNIHEPDYYSLNPPRGNSNSNNCCSCSWWNAAIILFSIEE